MSSLQQRFGLPGDLKPFICHSACPLSSNVLVFQLTLRPLSVTLNVISPTTFWSSNWPYALYLPLCMSSLQQSFGLLSDLTPFICHSVCHLSNNALVFQVILNPLSVTLYVMSTPRFWSSNWPYALYLPLWMSSLQQRFGLPTDLTPFICHSECHLSNNVLVFQLILRPLSVTLNVISPTTFWSSNWSYALYLTFCASNGPRIVIHSGDVPRPFLFQFCYTFSYVCHSGSWPSGGVSDVVFSDEVSVGQVGADRWSKCGAGRGRQMK